MNIPPPLSAASVDKMSRVVDQADAAVDAGHAPAVAIAKAATDHGLPIGHVPIVVRSFNTGRAVRQLGEADPWAKAADYPSTTADAVCAALGAPAGPTAKVAAEADYAFAPGTAPAAGTAKQAAPLPAVAPSKWTKEALARVAAEAALAPPTPRPNPGHVRSKAAALLDDLRDALVPLTLEQYAGVKAAAAHAWPGGGAETLAFVEAQNPRLGYKAAAAADRRPDPLVTTDHRAVGLVGQICALKAAYTEPEVARPLGYAKVAGTADWFVRRPVVGTVALDAVAALTTAAPAAPPTPTGDGPIGLGAAYKSAADEPDAAPAPDTRTGIGRWAGDKADRATDYYTPKPGQPAAGTPVGKGFNKTFFGGLSLATNNRLTAPVFDVRLPPPGDPDDAAKALGDKTRRDMAAVDDTAALQSVVADPRLASADPRTLIETYQSLSKLAPSVMKNPAVAADFLHRRVQTGPLSTFDLKQLIDMEKAYVGSRAPARPVDDDSDY